MLWHNVVQSHTQNLCWVKIFFTFLAINFSPNRVLTKGPGRWIFIQSWGYISLSIKGKSCMVICWPVGEVFCLHQVPTKPPSGIWNSQAMLFFKPQLPHQAASTFFITHTHREPVCLLSSALSSSRIIPVKPHFICLQIYYLYTHVILYYIFLAVVLSLHFGLFKDQKHWLRFVFLDTLRC